MTQCAVHCRRGIRKPTYKGVSKSWWLDLRNQREFWDDLAKAEGVTRLCDWYNIKKSHVTQHGGYELLRLYNNCVYKALSTAYPELNFVPWKFSSLPQAYWKERANVRRFCDDLAKELHILDMEKWYSIKGSEIQKRAGNAIMVEFNHSPYRLLSFAYPDHKFLPWKFRQVPKGYWKDINNVREFMQWLGTQLSYKSMDDWYSLTCLPFKKLKFNGILSEYSYSPPLLVMTAFPEHDWQPWKFSVTPKGYWSDPKNMRKFLEHLQKELGVTCLSDWYKVTPAQLKEHVHRLPVFDTLQAVLSYAYPEHNWEPWKFVSVPKNFWSRTENIRHFFDSLARELNITEMSQWYNVTNSMIESRGGSSLMIQFGKLPWKALSAAYPEHNFLPWRFKQVPKQYWKDIDNIKSFLSWMSERLGYTRLEDWYNVQREDFVALSVVRVLKYFSNSPAKLVMTGFPEHAWLPWKFTTPPRSRWANLLHGDRKQVERISAELLHYLESSRTRNPIVKQLLKLTPKQQLMLYPQVKRVAQLCLSAQLESLFPNTTYALIYL